MRPDWEQALGPVLSKVLQEMAANVNKVIDGKLGVLTQNFNAHSDELQNTGKRLNEEEDRILNVKVPLFRWRLSCNP